MSVDDIKKYRTLVESAFLNEAYEDRVREIASIVFSTIKGKPASKEDLLRRIRYEAEFKNVPEIKAITNLGKPSPVRKEFIKDVLKTLIPLVREPDPVDDNAVDQKKLEKLSDIIQTEVGSAFPDGDPLDMIFPAAKRAGMDQSFVENNLDAAAELLGSHSYSDYVASLWDQIKDDSPDYPGLQDQNPWR